MLITRRDEPDAAGRAARTRWPGGSRRWSGTPGWASRRWSTRWSRTPTGAVGRGQRGRQGPAHDRRGAGAAAARRPRRLGGGHARACGRSGWRTSRRTTSSPRSTTSPPRSTTARAAAGTSGRRRTPSARSTRWSQQGELRARPARRAAPGARRVALDLSPCRIDPRPERARPSLRAIRPRRPQPALRIARPRRPGWLTGRSVRGHPAAAGSRRRLAGREWSRACSQPRVGPYTLLQRARHGRSRPGPCWPAPTRARGSRSG